MNPAGSIVASHLAPILFIYGLSFFCLGLMVLLQSTSKSEFALRRFLWQFAAFGILHGLSEWADMFVTLGPSYWTPRGIAIIQTTGFCLAVASFLFLMDFGVSLAWLKKLAFPRIRTATRFVSALFVMLIFIYGIVDVDKHAWIVNSNVLMRYFLGFPAAVLAGIGFYRKSKFDDIAALHESRIRNNMVGMASCFLIYGILAGIVVPAANFFPASVLNYSTFLLKTGIPIQLARAACAVCIAGLVYPILSMFSLETTRVLERALDDARDAQENLEGKVRERTAELALANQKLLTEVEERARLEEEALRAREAADQANRAKSEFLANMSHEIRTPLNGLVGMVDLSLDTPLSPEQRNYLETAKRSADSLLKVINDILDFSKIEARKLELDHAEFALRTSLGETVAVLALRAEQKGLELLLDIDHEVPDEIIGDVGRLRQILLNLVGNALKFTDRGEILVKVRRESQTATETTLQFTVSDTGIGIAKEKHESIFEAFRQADNSTTRVYGGTGLGLAISVQLVHLMGGRIWLESEPQQGSKFHFTARFGISNSSLIRPVLRTLINMQGLPVLLVDDNATSRRILHEMVSHWHMRPTACESGSAALDALQAAKGDDAFSLVIVDRNMPEMDGFEFISRVRRNPALTGSSIMMLSSSSKEGDFERCRELGVATYLTKPVRQSELLNAIVTAMSQPHLTSAVPLPTPEPDRWGEGFTVLLAEDNPVNQHLAEKLLQKRKCEVEVVATGKAALAALERRKFDFVLMDIQMPEMDGLQATRAIREKEKATGQHIPVIALTAHAMKGDRERCMEAGMDGYVTKPIQSEELFSTIALLIPRDGRDPGSGPELGNSVIDVTLLHDRVENDDQLLKELIDLFRKDCPRMLGAIAEAVERDDPRGLEASAHALRGAASALGAKAAADLTLQLENLGRERETAEARHLYASLKREMERLDAALAGIAEAPVGARQS